MAQRPSSEIRSEHRAELPLAALLSLVVCPVCHETLAAEEAAILCTGCGRRYPVRDGIPVLIAAESDISTK
jgi:uncharacterized protein YbaR (Trm112 family)